MATASKRITRKDLKKPDWFQVNSEKVLEFFADHKPLVIGAAIALVLIVIANWGWQQFKDKQDVAAGREFSKAVTAYQAEQYKNAIVGFEKVQTYRWSHYAPLAHIYLANSYLATNDADKALSAAQRSITATKPGSLYRQIALIAVAAAEERKNQCKSAIDHYAEAEQISAALQGEATLGKARCAEQLGNTKTAIDSYREYLKGNPGSEYALKLSELEAQSKPLPAAHLPK
ncbi:MAG: tetratricopeptide repeat protein [Candidatus Binatia bacterium]